MRRVSFYTRPYDRLEPYDGKLSRTVLRGGAGSNASLLPDIHSEKDILKLVTTLIANTKGEGKAGDDFWVKAETLLYCALIGYIHYEAPVEEQNFSTLIEFINAMEVREDDEEFKNPVDLMFDALETEKPNHFAVRQYKKYKLAAGKTAKIHFTRRYRPHCRIWDLQKSSGFRLLFGRRQGRAYLISSDSPCFDCFDYRSRYV